MMSEFKANCLVCGEELIYLDKSEPMRCVYCGQQVDSNARCLAGHFVCDQCHSLPGTELIKQFCINTILIDPLEIALTLMRDERIKMHGPEHHFLVPAALLAAYYNTRGDLKSKSEKIEQAQGRAKNVLGGFCGFYGTCGAAVGTGIFISLITGATPLSRNEWKLSNLMTSQSLKSIAEHSGPRCCKRDTFLAILNAIEFLAENFDTKLAFNREIKCEFSDYNRECPKTDCPFYA
jgi:hypothetical protein